MFLQELLHMNTNGSKIFNVTKYFNVWMGFLQHLVAAVLSDLIVLILSSCHTHAPSAPDTVQHLMRKYRHKQPLTETEI